MKVKGDHVPSHLKLKNFDLEHLKIDYDTESPLPKSVLNTLGVVDTRIRIKYKNSGSTVPKNMKRKMSVITLMDIEKDPKTIEKSPRTI